MRLPTILIVWFNPSAGRILRPLRGTSGVTSGVTSDQVLSIIHRLSNITQTMDYGTSGSVIHRMTTVIVLCQNQIERGVNAASLSGLFLKLTFSDLMDLICDPVGGTAVGTETAPWGAVLALLNECLKVGDFRFGTISAEGAI